MLDGAEPRFRTVHLPNFCPDKSSVCFILLLQHNFIDQQPQRYANISPVANHSLILILRLRHQQMIQISQPRPLSRIRHTYLAVFMTAYFFYPFGVDISPYSTHCTISGIIYSTGIATAFVTRPWPNSKYVPGGDVMLPIWIRVALW